jgi:hypothetical protein
MTTRKRTVAKAAVPWLILDGEPCEVTLAWLREFVGSKRAYKIAVATYLWLASYDSDDYTMWYIIQALTTTDRLQDMAASERLVEGMRELEAMYPRACARAKAEVSRQLP